MSTFFNKTHQCPAKHIDQEFIYLISHIQKKEQDRLQISFHIPSHPYHNPTSLGFNIF